MASKKVLVTLEVQERHQQLLEQAADGQCTLIYLQGREADAADLEGAEIVIGNIPPALLKNSGVKLLQLNSAGYDNYVKAAKAGDLPEGCTVCNARGAYGLAVGEHMLALTFALIRHLAEYRDLQNEKKWQDCGSIISVEGAVIAVLGLGDIGGTYARKVRALEARKVIGVRRSGRRECPEYLDEQYGIEDLDRALPEADIVAMALPGSEETYHILDRRRLSLMKKGAYLINVGRGTAVDPQALLEALRSGALAGAALDVTEPEPLPQDSPLWEEPKVIITPHVAGNFFLQDTFERVVRIAGFNLAAYLAGRELKNRVQL